VSIWIVFKFRQGQSGFFSVTLATTTTIDRGLDHGVLVHTIYVCLKLVWVGEQLGLLLDQYPLVKRRLKRRLDAKSNGPHHKPQTHGRSTSAS
jgi:hypothetical protein